ncbi:MAG: PTS sugar transporter subunit IIA [Treponema sp.]|jgi:PTS system nitrogen regulatory IIA component|nr:PTS sugar transporter subunit IIA [Treponema sp.]
MKKSEPSPGLGELLIRGGIYYSVLGNTVQETLEFLVGKIPLPNTVSSQDLLKAMLEREALMSTCIGNGIAIPHPRNPMVQEPQDQFAAIAFLEHTVDWKALDGKAVDTLIIIVSASAKFHLQTLSAVSYFTRQDAFQSLIRERAQQETLIKYISETEKNWKQTGV